MSKYTTELRWIVEYEEAAYSKTDVTNPVYHEGTIKKIGLDTYPIFEESYRPLLNKKIIDHFYFREIGFETAAQFAFYMRRTMNEIMPYYNQLYKSELLELDPLRDVDMWYDINQTIDNDQKWNQTNTDDYTQDHTENWSVKTDDDLDKTYKEDYTKDNSEDYTKDNITYTVGHDESVDHTDSRDHNRNVYSDTPMSMLTGDDQGRIENLNYATTVTYDDGTGTTDSTHKDDNTSDTTANEEKHLTADEEKHLTGSENSERDINEVGNRTKKDTQDRDMTESGNKSTDEILHNVKHEAGFRQSQAELLQKYRDTFLNIDMMVIKDLEDLFMGVW